jgi:hypothetical protein
MYKLAVIIYHKNAEKIYNKHWILKCIESLQNQTIKDFVVFELNYGGEFERYYPVLNGQETFFESKSMHNHIDAMNYLIDKAFKKGFDVVFNVNLDDYYSPLRFQKQVLAIENGAQLVSSNFYYFTENRPPFKQMEMAKFQLTLGKNLDRNHNVIAHPVVAMHKSFWEEGLKYNNLIGFEDLDLWQRAFKLGKKFKILSDYLLYYRIHENQITKKHKGK